MKTKPIRLVVTGCAGRMGSLILEEALKDPDRFQPVGAIEAPLHPSIGQTVVGSRNLKVTDDLPAALSKADLLIEFTTPEATLFHARQAIEAKAPMVIGTTGFGSEEMEHLRKAAAQIPIFWSPNMSTGVLITRKALEAILSLLEKSGLKESTEIKISETHHTKKKDAPSGTAKQLRDDIEIAWGLKIPDKVIEAKREGDIAGIHRVDLKFGSEEVRLEHIAHDRRIFAQGALRIASAFLQFAKEPRLYVMNDYVKAMGQGTKDSLSVAKT